ncbi:MAG: glycoside hydrolase [Chloroflexi bacterium HGW-Chloroflexi-10]|nr:MAG: glycoside hydrolase [Chloroflexi bacterium HGW-Chloroflexi-10]
MRVWMRRNQLPYVLVILAVAVNLFGSCVPSSTPAPATTVPATLTVMPVTPISSGAYNTGVYRNLFNEYLGKTDAEIKSKLETAWNQLFYGDDDNERVYYPSGEDMGYMVDIGNGDVRSEGMSYGMMIAVQLDKHEEFDRLWKWTKTNMYQSDGAYQGYFAWHCTTDGKQLEANPASDGEEWFVMALLFASARWGNGEGIFDYQAEAQEILNTMLHKEETKSDLATNMFNWEHKQVVFVPAIGRVSSFTDPSYHLPAYYELWARWAEQDNDFWFEAAQTSRDYFKKAAHPVTGLMPDYANFDGTPYGTDDHKDFRFDAWRTLSNVALDHAWFAADPWQVEQSNRVLDFLASEGISSYANQYTLDGTALSSEHSTGLVAMAAAAALAADPEKGKPFVQELWDTQIPSGKWRYYDGLLYMLGFMQVSGNFRIYINE